MRDVDTTKNYVIKMLPGRFLKGGTDVLAKPVTDISKISISLNKFPIALKLGEVKQAFQKRPKN